MTFSTIQNAFVGGEISPSLYGRTDLGKWHNSAFTMRNFFANYRGGASTRAGFRYVGKSLQDAGVDGNNPSPRLINFQFNINQGYALEFGEQTVVRAVTGTADNGGLIRLTLSTTRGLFSGNTMVVTGVGGTTGANGTWTITVDDTTHVTLLGSTYAGAYTSGGSTSTVAGYMRIVSNGAYVVEDNNPITAITKANPGVFSYTNTNYTLANGDWVYISGVGGMTDFNGLTWIVQNATSTTFTVTDLFGNPVDTTSFSTYTSGGTLERIYTAVSPYATIDLPWLKLTQSADTMSLCCVNQDTLTEYPPYDLVRTGATNWAFNEVDFGSSISAPGGLAITAYNSTTLSTYYSYVVTAVSTNGEESVASTPAQVQNNDISVNAGSNALTWNGVSGASSYNVYAATPQYGAMVPENVAYGFIGTTTGNNFVDTNIVADFTKVPPVHTNPFASGAIDSVTITNGGSGYTAGSVTYSISSATGSGFVGTPNVTGGAVTGMTITSSGTGYDTGDTITFSAGSGTGAATGYVVFNNSSIDAGEYIVLNGVTWTFVASGASGNQTNVGVSKAATVAQLVVDLNASANASISVATYADNYPNLGITYDTVGTIGNAYTLGQGNGSSGVSGPTLTGGASSVTATGTLNISSSSGTYPGVPAYFQQRRYYAATLDTPNTYWASQPGAYTNFDTSIPVSDGDSFSGTPWAQQVNGIQAMLPMTAGLVILTGNGAWLLTGGTQSAVTASSQTATAQAYNGASPRVPPLVLDYDILYVQAKGSIVRDLSFNFFVNIFTGTDKTVLSSHLFNYHQIVQWCYAEEPFKVVWAVRDDGILLSLTYLKEQDVYAWARHDTNGFFTSVCSVTEPPVNAVYAVVKRYINDQWVYYVERQDNRNWQNPEDCFCVDSGLSYPLTYPNTTLTPSAADGTNNISSVLVIAGGSGYTAPTARAVDSTGRGSGATFSVSVSGGQVAAIVPLTEGDDYTPGLTTIEISDPTGSGAIAQPVITNIISFTTSSAVFSADNVGDVIRIGNNNASPTTTDGVTNNGGGQAVITEYVSTTEVLANIVSPITAVITDNPNAQPIPAISGQWSLSTPTDTVSGLNHLEGETVSILADGSVVPNQVVTDGSITLPEEASVIVVGLPYICQLQTSYLDVQGQETMQGDRKNVTSAVIRVELSRGFTTGTNQPDASTQPNYANVPWTNMKPVKQRNALIDAGAAIPLATGDFYVNLPSNWDIKGQVAIQQEYPLPVNVLAVVSTFIKGDSSGP